MNGKMWSDVHGAFIPDRDCPDPRDATIAALQSEIARMQKALEPFAEYARVLDSSYPTPHGGEFEIAPRICGPDDLRHVVTITLADLRRAALSAPDVTRREDKP